MAKTETVRVNIATVGTQQAAKDTKSLKQQIRDLREELANLDQGTDAYNQKIQELGNLLHQQSEITEQARIATQDYGQTLNNLNTIASGVVGSITAVQGVMNLLGAENEDAMKAVKTMTSLMSILQGLSALDQFEKTMGRMWTNMKKLTTATNQENVAMKANTVEAGKNAGAMAGAAAATKAQGAAAATTTKDIGLLSVGFKNLGRAIKAFMVSNPFTLILLGVTALITAISKLVSDTKEANEQFKKMQLEAKLANAQASGMSFGTGESDDQRRQRGVRSVNFSDIAAIENDEKQLRLLGELERGLQKVKTTIEQYGYALIDAETQEKILANTSVKDINDLNQVTEALLKTRNELNGVLYKQYAAQVNAQQELIDLLQQEYNLMTDNGKNAKAMQAEEAKALEERLKTEKQVLEGYTNRRNKVMDDLAAIEDAETARAKKQRQDEEAAEKDRENKYRQWQAEQRKLLDDEYNKQKTQADNQYKAGLTSAEEYYNKLKKIEDDYLKSYIDNKKRIGLTQKEEEVFTEAYRSRIIGINKSLQAELLRIWKERNDIQALIKANTLKLETEQAEEAVRRLNEDTEGIGANDNYYERQYEFAEAWIVKKLSLVQNAEDAEFESEYEANQRHLQLQAERLQKDLEFIERENEINTGNEDLAYNNRLEELQMEKDAELQVMETYAQQTNATEEQIAQRRAEIEAQYNTKVEELRTEHLSTLQSINNGYIQDRADAEYQLAETIYQLHENEYQHEVDMFNRKLALTRQYLQAFSTMVGGVQGLLTELQGAYEQGSKQYEAIEEANIIMSGITGALQAWQSGMAAAPAPWNLAIAAAMSGISVATTIAALANLKNKKLSTSASQASLNITPYETVATETGAELNGQISDTRVYVVEEDIADTARRVYVAESEASF